MSHAFDKGWVLETQMSDIGFFSSGGLSRLGRQVLNADGESSDSAAKARIYDLNLKSHL